MVAVNSFRRLAENARKIPGKMGLHEHSATLLVSTWDGNGRFGTGPRQETQRIPILVGGQNPKVTFPSQRDIAQGIMSVGTITIGPLTPEFYDALGVADGGTIRELIDRELIDRAGTLHILVRGPQHPKGAKYKIENTNAEKAIHFTLRCSAVTGA